MRSSRLMRSEPLPLYFGGFSLCGEEALFEEWMDTTPFCVNGFSFGAIRAFEYCLTSGRRVDVLRLFSPAFFQDRDEKYRRLQLMFYKKDRAAYTGSFLQNCSYPSAFDLTPYLCEPGGSDLKTLLEYRWDEKLLQKIVKNGTKIEIHLGGRDKIIDAKKACAFFKPYARIYFYHHFGHILKG